MILYVHVTLYILYSCIAIACQQSDTSFTEREKERRERERDRESEKMEGGREGETLSERRDRESERKGGRETVTEREREKEIVYITCSVRNLCVYMFTPH